MQQTKHPIRQTGRGPGRAWFRVFVYAGLVLGGYLFPVRAEAFVFQERISFSKSLEK